MSKLYDLQFFLKKKFFRLLYFVRISVNAVESRRALATVLEFEFCCCVARQASAVGRRTRIATRLCRVKRKSMFTFKASVNFHYKFKLFSVYRLYFYSICIYAARRPACQQVLRLKYCSLVQCHLACDRQKCSNSSELNLVTCDVDLIM